MRKCLLALLLGVCFTSVFSQSISTGTLAATDPTFNRPDEGAPPTTLSITGTNVPYHTITITVAVPSIITFNSASVWDNFMILYGPAEFNPLLPLENALIANDDFNGPNSGFTYIFNTAGTYTLVICSFKNDVTGPYTVTTSAPIPLPLKLLSFTAMKGAGHSNVIKWSTAEESNLTAYQVQFSVNNNNFSDLKNGYIQAKNSTIATSYSFVDNNPAEGYDYYRLKITERSGAISFSPVALVKNTRPGLYNLHVFPNPSAEYVKLEAKSMQKGSAYISIVNTLGQVMQSGQYNFDGQGILSVDIKKLSAGKYFLRAAVDKDEATVQFIKN